MTRDRLVASLRELVREHGFERVSRSLRELDGLGSDAQGTKPGAGSQPQPGAGTRGKRKPAATALERVEKMDLPSETADVVLQLAKRFDEKSFMPTFGDIAHFCRVYDVDEPASKSRAAAVSRVFGTIAAMSAEDIQILVDYGAFSGPARLGPISEAITRRSRTQA